MTRAMYLGINKDNDELYSERVNADATRPNLLIEKAERIIFAPEAAARRQHQV